MKSIIIKSLINMILAWLLVALVICLKQGIGYGEALTAPYSIYLAIAAGVGSFIGFMIRKKMQ